MCAGLISWVKSGEHQKASNNRCWLTCSRSYYFPFSERVLIFPLSPLVFLSPSIHPACVGGIKVALLSSKLQISFASVHLTLCFITAARGGRRFRSALHKVMTPTGCYSPLSLTPPLLHSLAGGIIFVALPLLGNTVKIGSEASSWRMWHVCHELPSKWQSCNSCVCTTRPRTDHIVTADSTSPAHPALIVRLSALLCIFSLTRQLLSPTKVPPVLLWQHE